MVCALRMDRGSGLALGVRVSRTDEYDDGRYRGVRKESSYEGFLTSLIGVISRSTSLVCSLLTNYSASSPSSPLLPTVNNGSTQMTLDPQSNTGLDTDGHCCGQLRLNSAVATETIYGPVCRLPSIWLSRTPVYGLWAVHDPGAFSGTSRVGSALFGLDFINIVPITADRKLDIRCHVAASYLATPGPTPSQGV